MDLNWAMAAALVASSLLTALAALLLVSFLPAWPRPQGTAVQFSNEDTVFLFDDESLVDATRAAHRLLSQAPRNPSDWHRLTALLGPRFPGLATKMRDLAAAGEIAVEEADGQALLRARMSGALARIELIDPPRSAEDAGIDRQSLAALDAELDMLRQVVAQMPALAWQQNAEGAVIWANRAYMTLVEETRPGEDALIWPLPHLFDATGSGPMSDDLAPRRLSVTLPDGTQKWFDCMAFPQQGKPMFFALSADAAAQAETALTKFIQTLTKTFAGLPTGIAIFNRNRNLVMFNPALVDLCRLDPQFLAMRPTLFAFLDQLREHQIMPEPKNYKTWREKMTALEEDAASGGYEETWTMHSGQTYRVSGRPHPDGAVAFLFEDISSEISLTRRFRAEIEMGQAVLDSMDEAIAIFSSSGVLTMSNAAYVRLWGRDPSMTLGDIDVHEALLHWQTRCEPSPAWNVVRDRIAEGSTRKDWQGAVRLHDGRPLKCRLTPIAGGATLIGFSTVSAAATLAPEAHPAVSDATV